MWVCDRGSMFDRTVVLHSSICFRTVGVLCGYFFLPVLIFRVDWVAGIGRGCLCFVPEFRYKETTEPWAREDQGDGHGQRCYVIERILASHIQMSLATEPPFNVHVLLQRVLDLYNRQPAAFLRSLRGSGSKRKSRY